MAKSTTDGGKTFGIPENISNNEGFSLAHTTNKDGFKVLSPEPRGYDRDGDGRGCEA